ncbi:MAG: class 1 fructose-bisphosphatase [Chloroflexi bacterium]|nr:MAG: class 1 fructose-bisphosphatase [Chloroflexota bacterium]
MHEQIVTIERHIIEQQREYPEATGAFSNLMYDIALAAKIVARETTRAGLVEILGLAGKVNVQGEEQMKLDVFANETMIRVNSFTGRLAVMASEEIEGTVSIPGQYGTGKYVLVFDPLDGSSNVDVNASIGTIFGIYRRLSAGGPGTLADCLQKGRHLAAAGYVIYGSSTMLVYTTGQGVHGFTLDPGVGEFLLSHPNIRIPERARYYSVNHGNEMYWSTGVKKFTRWLQGLDQDDGLKKPLSSRYIGSLVADFHRTVLKGGIFYYPADSKRPEGKLRLIYEVAPLAFIVEQAGGYASDGRRNVLDIQPEGLHQRVPLFIGDRELVKRAEEFIARYDE